MENENLKKAAALSTAAMMSMAGATPALAQTNVNNVEAQQFDYDINNMDNVLDDLYQQQMNYLVPTVEKLKEFYSNVDTKNIIKTGYGNAYNVINTDLGYETRSYGYNSTVYISKNQDLVSELKKNNQLINSLKIKSTSARDTDYQMIFDGSNLRLKTKEDNDLIDNYTNIVGYPITINENLINLLNDIKNKNYDNIDDEYLNALTEINQAQNKYIFSTKSKLKDFYENIDTKNIIKNGYNGAYNAYLDNNYYNIDFSDENEIESFLLESIKNNNNIITSMRINGITSRTPDYNVIVDPSAQMGIRQKTSEDKELIEQYSNIVGTPYVLPISVIKNLENVPSLSYTRAK